MTSWAGTGVGMPPAALMGEAEVSGSKAVISSTGAPSGPRALRSDRMICCVLPLTAHGRSREAQNESHRNPV